MWPVVVLLLTALGLPGAQDAQTTPFVMDANKPYVYLEFDHVGQRKPLGPDEGKQGLWLRFVNNCRVPVTIGTFGTGTEDPGIGVIDEVVAILPSGSGGIPELEGTRPRHAVKPPEGYDVGAEVHSLATVDPGESVLFSVPLNHVSPDWYLRVEFTLDVSDRKVGDQPYSYADFRWDKLPDAVRSRSK